PSRYRVGIGALHRMRPDPAPGAPVRVHAGMPKRSKATGRQVNFTHPDKIYFPGTGTTKGEIIRYYLEVAPWLLPHLEDRPVTLIRVPKGHGGESFYERKAPAHAREWIQTFRVPRRRHEGE